MAEKVRMQCANCGAAGLVAEEMRAKPLKCPKCGTAGKWMSATEQKPQPQESDLIECPYCAEKIKAKAIKCRHCGEMLSGPNPAASRQPESEEDEKTLWTGKPSFLYAATSIIICGFFMLFGLTVAIMQATGKGGSFAAMLVTFIIFFVIPGLFLAAKLLPIHFTSYELTSKRAKETCGVFSKFENEVRLQDIRNVRTFQNFAERIFKLGSVAMDTAAGDNTELSFSGIPNMKDVAELVKKYRG